MVYRGVEHLRAILKARRKLGDENTLFSRATRGFRAWCVNVVLAKRDSRRKPTAARERQLDNCWANKSSPIAYLPGLQMHVLLRPCRALRQLPGAPAPITFDRDYGCTAPRNSPPSLAIPDFRGIGLPAASPCLTYAAA